MSRDLSIPTTTKHILVFWSLPASCFFMGLSISISPYLYPYMYLYLCLYLFIYLSPPCVSAQGQTTGFTLDSLLKLNTAKAFDKKTSILHYLVILAKRNDPTLLDFKDVRYTQASSTNVRTVGKKKKRKKSVPLGCFRFVFFVFVCKSKV